MSPRVLLAQELGGRSLPALCHPHCWNDRRQGLQAEMCSLRDKQSFGRLQIWVTAAPEIRPFPGGACMGQGSLLQGKGQLNPFALDGLLLGFTCWDTEGQGAAGPPWGLSRAPSGI